MCSVTVHVKGYVNNEIALKYHSGVAQNPPIIINNPIL